MVLLRDVMVTASLAASDFQHEFRLSLCLICALAAVMAPLMVLFGLRYGIVSTLRTELRHNPTTLQLQPLTHGSYDHTFFTQLQQRPETGFVLPNTRFLAATVTLDNPQQPSRSGVDTELIPTSPGDPLLQTDVSRGKWDQVGISQTAAEKLHLAPGDTAVARLARLVGEEREVLTTALRVQEVVPVARYARDAIFVAPELLLMAEDYREGFAVPRWQTGGRQRPEGERLYASFRLYARDIDDVAALRDWLAARGIDTDTRLSEIRLVQRLDRSLTLLFLVVAGLGGLGFCLSLAISMWGNVERKRYQLSVLRLLGLSSTSLAVFPVMQALLTALGGCILSALLCAISVPMINRWFAEGLTATQVVCRLPVRVFLQGAGFTIVLSTGAAAAAAWRATMLSPAEGLRHE